MIYSNLMLSFVSRIFDLNSERDLNQKLIRSVTHQRFFTTGLADGSIHLIYVFLNCSFFFNQFHQFVWKF